MVGIVIVSHSRRLADAAVELALQMVRGTPPPIEVAAGLDGHVLGTDAAGYGLLMTGLGVGAVASAVAMVIRGPLAPSQVAAGSALLGGATVALGGPCAVATTICNTSPRRSTDRTGAASC